MAAKASCQVTIADITDAYSVVLTSETYTFMGNTSGAPIGSACTTQAIAYQGDTQCSKVTIGTISCPTGISASVSNNGMASPTITFKTTAVISTACEASVPVIIDGITIYKKFSFAVANQGASFGWNLLQNTSGEWSDYWQPYAGTNIRKDISSFVIPDGCATGETFTTSIEIEWTGFKSSSSGTFRLCSQGAQDGGWTHVNPFANGLFSISTESGKKTCTLTGKWDGSCKKYMISMRCDYSNGEGKIRWRCLKIEKGTKATEWTPHPDDLIGDTGKGIKSTAITYQASISGTTVPTGTWSGSIPTVSAGQYLWVRTIFSYSDNTTSTIYSVSRMGANGATGTNGKSIGSVVNYYLATASSSGVTAATSGWTTAVQSVSATKKYLWNYEVVKYTDGTVASTTAPCVIGSYGDQGSKGDKGDKGDKGSTGTGIKSITEHYAVSTSNSTVPTSWSSTVPTMTESNKYLWNYETITYTNGTAVDTTKRVTGVYGNKGTTGATGSQGYSLVANVVRDAFTESRWTTYGTINHEETWSSTSGIRNGCRIGDMFAIVGTATDTKNAHVAYYRSNTASGDLKGICISHTIIPRGATGATGSKGDKGDKGESDIKCYPLTGGSNQIVWSKLGTLTSAGDNSNFIINVYTGSGYNGYAYQNSQAEIVIKDGWQSSASTASAFGVSVTRQNCDDLKVQVRATASNKCDVWIYLPWSYSWGTYTISGKYTSWALSNTTQTAEPTTGTLQDLAYRINPENAAKTATNFMEFTSGVGLQIGNKTNGSWSGYRTKISSSAFEILNQAGTVLASYGEKLIQLGKNATDAVIELCGGKGKIKYEQMWTYGGKDPTLTVSGQNTALLGDDKVLVKMQHNSNGNRYTRQLFASENNIHIGMFKGKATDPDEADDIEACITETADGIKLDVPSKNIALEAVQINMTTLSKLIYPVGSIYMSANSTNPKNLFGGTWVAWGTGRVPIGVNASDSDFSYVEKTGGSKTINLSHKHLETVGADNGNMYLEGGSNGGRHGSGIAASISRMTWKGTVGTGSARLNYTDSAGNTKQSVVQPYITCYMWKRTA